MKELYETGISPDGTYYYARAFRVPYTAEIAIAVAGELLHLGDKKGIFGCLIDIRGTTSVSSVLDKYKFAYEKTKFMNLPHRWRFAFLKDQVDDSPDFIETVMQNAGFLLKIFENEHDAIDWLKGAQSG